LIDIDGDHRTVRVCSRAKALFQPNLRTVVVDAQGPPENFIGNEWKVDEFVAEMSRRPGRK